MLACETTDDQQLFSFYIADKALVLHKSHLCRLPSEHAVYISPKQKSHHTKSKETLRRVDHDSQCNTADPLSVRAAQTKSFQSQLMHYALG